MAKRHYHIELANKILSFESKTMDRMNHFEERYDKICDRISSIEKKLNALVSSDPNAEVNVGSNGTSSVSQAPFIHQLADYVSVIGLKEILLAKHRALKWAWLLLFLFGIGVTGYFVYDTINDYFEEPTLSKIKYQPKRMFEYPPIVFCHDGWFDTEKATNLGLSIDGLKYALQYLPIKITVDNATEARENFYRIYRQHEFSSLINFYQHIMVDLEPKSNQTTFKDSTAPSFLSLNGKYSLEKIYIPFQASMCYKFSIPPFDSQFLVLVENDAIYLKTKDLTQNFFNSQEVWRMYLAEKDAAAADHPLYLHPSMEYKVTISSKILKSLNKHDAPCSDSTGGTCSSSCMNTLFQKAMNCQMFATSADTPLAPWEYCDYYSPLPANSSVSANTDKALSEMGIICANQCFKKCQRVFYDTTVNGFVPIEAEGGNSNLSTIGVNFMHEGAADMEIMVIEEVNKYSFTGLMNDVGGMLGLFIGGTVFTFAQLIFFFIGHICEKRKNIQVYPQM